MNRQAVLTPAAVVRRGRGQVFYRAAEWSVGYKHLGQFESGRPFLLVQFNAAPAADAGGNAADAAPAAGASIWLMAVHLNHFFLQYPDKLDPVQPGSVLAAAFRNASLATGTAPSPSPAADPAADPRETRARPAPQARPQAVDTKRTRTSLARRHEAGCS